MLSLASITWVLPAPSVVLAAMVVLAPIPVAHAEASREDVAAPTGTLVATFHAVGAQIYECKPDQQGNLVWSFREPIAALTLNGKTVGRHFTGPTWQMADGSLITGKLSAQAAAPSGKDIPWLKLQVSGRQGSGDLDGVTVIQRVATQGGTKSGPCPSAGELRAEPYAADYLFSRP